MTRSTDGRTADGLFTDQDLRRVSAIAIKNDLVVMPKCRIERPDAKLPAELRKFVGVWASDIGFGSGVGRHAMLIVTNVASPTRASGYYVLGSPTARGLYQSPASVNPIDGKIAGNQLTFQNERFGVTATFSSSGNLSIAQKQRDGKILAVSVNPVWRLLEAERSAKK